MRPMRLPPPSVNQTDPSGAMATVVGPLFGCGNSYSVGLPSVVNCAAATKDASRRQRMVNRLGDNLWNQLAADIGEAHITAVEAIGQLGVIHAEQVQYGRVQVVNRCRLFGRFVAEVVGRSDHLAA